jgi:flagellar hook assembly protein FlgD
VTEFSLAIATMSGRLDIFDVQGRLVWSSGSISIQPEGSTRVRWDGRDQGGRTVPGGVLLARWSDEATGAVIATGKIIRLP